MSAKPQRATERMPSRDVLWIHDLCAASPCGRGRRDSREPAGCPGSARRSGRRSAAPRRARTPRTRAAPARAAARQRPRPGDRQARTFAPTTGGESGGKHPGNRARFGSPKALKNGNCGLPKSAGYPGPLGFLRQAPLSPLRHLNAYRVAIRDCRGMENRCFFLTWKGYSNTLRYME